MLILTRRVGETVVIGEDIVVTVLSIKGNQVRIGVQAPKDVAVHRNDHERTLEILQAVAAGMGARAVRGEKKIAKISIVGVGMRSHAGIASRMFRALAADGINIRMISTSEIKISVVVDEKYAELGVRALHSEFGLDRANVAGA